MSEVRFELVDTSDEEIDAIEAAHAELDAEIRRLAELNIRTLVAPERVAALAARVREVNAVLAEDARPGPVGVAYNATGRAWGWGNAATGSRNPVAPPLLISTDGDVLRGTATLGARYEGPPGHVHGGIAALLLDHLMGTTASGGGRLTMTGTLTLRYRAPLPLGEVALEGWISKEEGRKITVLATIAPVGEDGVAGGVAVEAEGLFVVPSWAPQGDARQLDGFPRHT